MNKRGLIGKIFAIIGIIFLVLILIVGISAYQIYNLVKEVQEKTPTIQENIKSLTNGDCTKIKPIESDINDIKSKATSACKNPLIKIAVQKLEQVPIKCDQLSEIDKQITNDLEPIKLACEKKNTYQNLSSA